MFTNRIKIPVCNICGRPLSQQEAKVLQVSAHFPCIVKAVTGGK